jgi:O-antigen/teichoic acid export membrane protein
MVARILASSYTQSSPLLVSVRITGGSLGLFAASDRLLRAVQAVVDSLSLSLIPRMARSWARGDVTMRTLGVLVGASFGFGAVAGAGLAGLAPVAVHLLYGPAYDDVLPVIRLACLILPLTCTTGMLTTNVLMVGQRPRAVLLVHVVGLAAALLCVLLLGRGSGALAAVLCILVGEASALLATLILSRRTIAVRPT